MAIEFRWKRQVATTFNDTTTPLVIYTCPSLRVAFVRYTLSTREATTGVGTAILRIDANDAAAMSQNGTEADRTPITGTIALEAGNTISILVQAGSTIRAMITTAIIEREGQPAG